ncbi:MAG: histidine triad nucleotide-binding protein [Magnetococcales bacterium]|nr:histidine triad nucleotide-binding protein [Magnetococcales bacterium]
MSSACLFCRIANGEIPAKIIYADDHVLAFHDIHPQAPVHALVIPRQHIASLDDLDQTSAPLAGILLERAAHVARLLGVDQSGYRSIINTKEHGGQEIFHLHLHILGGQPIGPMTAR